jgi:hypothetical protein
MRHREIQIMTLLAAVLAVGGTAAGARSAAPGERCVYVAYFNPADRRPIPGYRERLDRIMTDVRRFYADEMKRNGYGPLTFPLERDAEGRLVVHLVQSAKSYAKGQSIEWDDIVGQVDAALALRGIPPETAHVVIFQNLIFRDGRAVACWAPYAGLGDHVKGRACVTDNAEVDPPNLRRSEPPVLVNGREQPLCQYVMAQMGGVAHELGHALGLPHNKETPEEAATLGTALMGRGNYEYRGEVAGRGRGSFLSKAHALLLSRHPLFQKDTRDIGKAPACTLASLDFRADAGRLIITGRARSAVPIAGLAVYLDPLPQNSDYDAGSWVAPVTRSGRFRTEVARQVPGCYELRLRFCHTNGAQTVFAYPYRLTQSDDPPAASLRRQYLFQQAALPAFEAKDRRALDAAIRRLGSEEDVWLRKARLLKNALDRREPELAELSQLAEDVREFPLSAAKWESATVGWEEPRRDLLSDAPYLMESGDDAHATGLYAHAPSRYVFRLGGRWKRFEAGCGLRNWVPGTVAFLVKGDGRGLYESGKIADWTERHVSVDVSGVDRLELIVEPTDDGKDADCSLWFSPRVVRGKTVRIHVQHGDNQSNARGPDRLSSDLD